MKNKLIKIIESPKVVIPAVFLVAVVVAIFVYKFVGYAPKGIVNDQTINSPTDLSTNTGVVDLAFPKTGRVNAVYVKAGGTVRKGQILANLDFADAKGALEIAKANYQKLINGATGADVGVAKAGVQAAQTNLDAITKQQSLAVLLAYRNLLNSSLEAVPDIAVDNYIAPTISGNYTLDKEGDIKISVNYTNGNSQFFASGVLKDYNGIVNATTAQPIGDSGLYIKFPANISTNISNWTIHIPNQKAVNYISNNNAYQSALETEDRLVKIAQASLDQANSALLLKISSARPEDVAAATGALAVAQGAYDNDFIYAPADGKINVVNIGVGEIAVANGRVISMTINNK